MQRFILRDQYNELLFHILVICVKLKLTSEVEDLAFELAAINIYIDEFLLIYVLISHSIYL